jgi:hypothetical protein
VVNDEKKLQEFNQFVMPTPIRYYFIFSFTERIMAEAIALSSEHCEASTVI